MRSIGDMMNLLERCLGAGGCEECGYRKAEDADRERGEITPGGQPMTCLDLMMTEALEALGRLAVNSAPPRLASLEELQRGWGHGWEESPPETPGGEPVPMEAVWLGGKLLLEDGCTGDLDNEVWRKTYGARGMGRVWRGFLPPTAAQMAETPWREPPPAPPADPMDGRHSGLITEE